VHSSSTQRCLVLFTKPPRPGRVKTRLIGRLSAAQAAALHAAFLADVLARLRRGAFDLRLAWALAPGEAIPSPAELARAQPTTPPADWQRLLAGIAHQRQVGGDLGARLHHGLAAAGRRYRYVAAAGSDHPELPAARVDGAFARLEAAAEVVVGPAADGGYYLIGARREALDPRLFAGVPWSSGAVLRTTLANAASLGLEVARLELGHDVDEPADLERLAARLASGGRASGACPHTRALLEAWGMLRAVPA